MYGVLYEIILIHQISFFMQLYEIRLYFPYLLLLGQAGPWALLKVRYSGSVNFAYINKCMYRFKHLVPCAAKFVCAASVQKNLFRILCPFMWRRDDEF